MTDANTLPSPCVCGWGGPGPCPCPNRQRHSAPWHNVPADRLWPVLPMPQPETGWRCPNCGAGNAPFVTQCPCAKGSAGQSAAHQRAQSEGEA